MTEKQRRFAEEYVIDLNGRRAYKAAFPSVKKDGAADACASRLLKDAKVRAYVDELLEKIRSEKTADATEVMEYLTAVMRGQTASSVLRFVGDGVQTLIDKTPDEKERLKAAELIGKRHGLFRDKVDVDGVVPVIISGCDAIED